jgi:hypothetical protein
VAEHRFYYRPSSTLAAFHESNAFVRGVMGPVGSGKSSAMCMELFRQALLQSPHEGVSRTRFAVIRNTYAELRTTALKTWRNWVCDVSCSYTGDGPVTARLRLPFGDCLIDSEILFLALNRPGDVKKLLSLELTSAWINEAREVPKEVVDGVTARVGRYPPSRLGGPDRCGLIMDTNPPDDDHWWYALAEEERPADWAFFQQPPALIRQKGTWRPNPLAENAEHLPDGHGYWLRQVAGKTEQWIKVYVLGQYGTIQTGRPVYPEYDDGRHSTSAELSAVCGRPLVLGWDFGLTPACVVTQESADGRLLILDELCSKDMGIRRFSRTVVKPLLLRKYPQYHVLSVGDPAGRARAQTDERTCMDELREAGLPTRPAPSNNFTARREAVAGFLSAFPDGKPAFLMSPGCKNLRKGFLGGYRFERIEAAGEAAYKDAPVKNAASHIHDALQYAALFIAKGCACPGTAKTERSRHYAPMDGAAGY